MDPRYRAVLVMSSLLLVLWGGQVAWTYIIGSGVNLDRYFTGVLVVGASTVAGFFLVWAAATLVALHRSLKTGFEADVRDEFGTGFEMTGPEGRPVPFKLSLSKFLPEMVAPPSWPGLHPLEAEILGFLQGYRHWPVDLNQQGDVPGKPFVSLYEAAVARWQVMRHMPGSTAWHRAVALAKDLALVHAYKEVRTTYPWHEFWKRDRVKFVPRCRPHGGITAFVFSTFPALRALAATPEGLNVQRALLTALRYQDNPMQLPLNAGPLARELVDYLWRADAQLQQLDVRELDQMTPTRWNELKANVTDQWLGVLGEISPVSTPAPEMTALKLSDGSVWLRQDHLLALLGPLLKPELRQTLRLWDTGGGLHHPSWAHLAPLLQDAGLIENTADGQDASNGCFLLACGDITWGPALKLHLDPARHGPMLRQWQSVPGWAFSPEILLDANQLAAHAQTQAGSVDAKIAELL